MTDDNPQIRFELPTVTGHVETDGIEIDESGDGYARAHRRCNTAHIQLGVNAEDDQHVVASASARFKPETARDVAQCLREDGIGTFQTDQPDLWVNKGWLYCESSRDHQHPTGRLIIDAQDGQTRLRIQTDEDNGVVHTETKLADETCEDLADAIDRAADRAGDYEPPTNSDLSDSTGSLKADFVKFAIPTGITLGVGYFVATAVNNALSDVTVNGEPLGSGSGMVPAVFFIIGISMLVYWTVLNVPPLAGGVGR